MTLVIGALTIGLILSVLALGIYISFRIFDFPDITAEGSITLGAAVAAILLVSGIKPHSSPRVWPFAPAWRQARSQGSFIRSSRSTGSCRGSLSSRRPCTR